jgi:ribose transport system ATP-binding protein
MELLEAKGMQKSFGGIKALSNGCLTCCKGKVVGLLGANGSGKSTFSKIIAGIFKKNGGELYICGEKAEISSSADAKKYRIAMVHQNLSLVQELTVWENINLGHESLLGGGFLNIKEEYKKAQKVLDYIWPGFDMDEKVANLTPAQKQLVEIAKALSQDPQILIMDEPTASLEHTQVERLIEVIEELKRKDIGIIFISHRMWEVMRICDSVVVFRNGTTVGEIDLEQDGKKEQSIVEMITGKSELYQEKIKRKKYVRDNEILELRDINLGNALKQIQLRVKAGEIIGIGGLNEQGQEDLLLLMAGYLKHYTGSILVDGKNIKLTHPIDAIRKGIVLVPGDRHKEGLFLGRSIIDNIVYPQIALGGKNSSIKKKDKKLQCSDAIEKMKIYPPDPNMIVSQLSGGNQQKIVVGKWLKLAPKVLLLSDPAKGVDIEAKREMYQVVAKLAESGTAVILFATDNDELIKICDKVYIMFEGRIINELHEEQLNDESLVAASFGDAN